ncbi:hypothetical protein [Lentiprolixibacter aurantiacus]|uniref:Uncharacterized protein n=1 Tax=Lentiprolixibacter aurantiacus TaxID=2993939 RepID=A0AAE3MIL5_9FLAO|nr:hypothetical protein [Lentiprolixibacter aurantiacus]MCX2717981.1 hypothetical protein [Lentiprolixibacter aurantiacus]
MKSLIAGILLVLGGSVNLLGQELSPYIKVTETTGSITALSEGIMDALRQNSFEVLGTYQPANSKSLKVIAFTRNDLKNTTVKVADRGALGAVLKVGLVEKEGRVTVSYTNPDYLLRAYLRDDFTRHQAIFDKLSKDLKKALTSVGKEFVPFGGTVKADKLKKYHYKIMMPYFTDPISLAEYSSFNQGLRIIRQNLKSGKGNTVKVYELVYPDKQVAVFGIGLKSTEDGESHFLPKIGVEHAAALPYEIILQKNEATMLHGKYRIALHWPDLTMGTFMKIMSTPGDIEDTLEGLCISSSADNDSR